MMKVLYVNPGATIGGAERSLLELIRALPRDRYEPHLLVPREGPLAGAARGAGAIVAVEPWPLLAELAGREPGLLNRGLGVIAPFALIAVSIRIARYVRRNGIGVIHTNGTKAHLAACGARVLTGVPLVWHLRDVVAPGALRALLTSLGAVLPARIIANSRASAASLVGRAADRAVVIYNGLDPDEFAPRQPDTLIRASLGAAAEDFVIGTVGALTPLKGQIHLIRAMPRVLASVPTARLLIVGEEMYVTLGHHGHRRILQEEAVRLGLGDRVVFAGSRQDIAAVYAAMDVVVLASVRPESFGRVLAEAMACGRPVIGTDLGGQKEIIVDARHGLLVPAADPLALSAAILQLHDDPVRRRSMGSAGRSRVLECFTMARHVAQVCDVYERLRPAVGMPARDGVGERAR